MRALLPVLAPFVLATAGCGTTQIKLGDDSGAAALDTADDTAGGDTDTTPPEPQPDYTVWNGTRNFYYSSDWYSCDDTITESGTAIDEGTSDWDTLHDLCGTCDVFYEVTPDTDTVCDVVPLSAGWRGVTFGDDSAAVVLFHEENGELVEYAEDGGADFDGTTIQYAYDFDYGATIAVTGVVTYPLVGE